MTEEKREEWLRFLREDPKGPTALRDVLRGEVAEDEVALELARLLEEAGRFREAFREYQRALRDRPEDPMLLLRLSELYEERGDLDRAAALAERAFRLGPGEPGRLERLLDLLLARDAFERAVEAVEEARAAGCSEERIESATARLPAERRGRDEARRRREDEDLLPFTDADLVRFLGLFQGRENVYARQWTRQGGETGYSPVHEPLTPEVLRNHLLGNITVGVYPLRLDGTVAFCAFDLDLTKRALRRARGDAAYARRLRDLVAAEGRRLYDELITLGIHPLYEDSGYKGRHLWVFFERPEPAALVRRFGEWFLRPRPPRVREVKVEFFPRQDRAGGKGLGNLIKLPLGVHRRTGRRCVLLDRDGTTVDDPFARLRSVERLEHDRFLALLEDLKGNLTSRPVPGESVADEEQEERSGDGEERSPSAEELAAAAEVPPPWTEADFERHPEISTLLARCPVLAQLKRRAETRRRLEYDERVVLKHAMGHSAAGVEAVNYLLDLCLDVPPEERLQSPLRGHPISCPKIRKRIPHVTAKVPCNCVFPASPEHYPTPRLHLDEVEAERKSAPSERPADGAGREEGCRIAGFDPVETARTLALLRERRERVDGECRELERRLFEWMERNAVTDLDLGRGVRLVLRAQDGAPPALLFEREEGGPRTGAKRPDAGRGGGR